MTDWHESRTNTYEYYLVDPKSWNNRMKLDNVTSGSVTRDAEKDTLVSATLEVDGEDLGEFYVRIYLVAIQNGIGDRRPLGTFLVQTSSSKFDGKTKSPSLTAYSPLLEMKDNQPPLGYAVRKGAKALEQVTNSFLDYCRAPVIPVSSPNDTLEVDFVADPNDTWISFNNDMLAQVKYYIDLDEMGRVMFAPIQEVEAMQPVFTYNDDNSSILYPEVTKSIDIYGIPNTLEVVYSGDDHYMTAVAINDDPNSLISTVSRGRTVFKRIENPGILGVPTQGELQEYANKTLRELSEVDCQISYQHGYNDVRINDCVRLNYQRAGLSNIKAKVIKQKINCDTECKVDETVVFKKKLWG